MFKVLVIAYYYPPMGLSGVQRTLKFTKYMKRFNWEPTVITAGNVAYFAHDLDMLREAEEAGVRIIRTEAYDLNSMIGKKYGTVNMPKEYLRKLYSKFSKTFFIPDNKKSWAKKAYNTARELLQKENFDIIYVTIPPYSSFMYAAMLKKEFNIPLFVDYRDLWFGNHFAYYPTPYHRTRHKKLEYEALRASDKVIVINRKIKMEMETVEMKKVLFKGEEKEAWRVRILMDQGDGKIKEENHWYIDGKGYIGGETAEHKVMMSGVEFTAE